MALPTPEDLRAVQEADQEAQRKRNQEAWDTHNKLAKAGQKWEHHDPKAIKAMYKTGSGEAAPADKSAKSGKR